MFEIKYVAFSINAVTYVLWTEVVSEINNNNNNKSISIAPNQSRLLSGALQNIAN